jgi:protein-L-isoaspartate(D-aspartate) O-methyltransferase
MPAIGASTTGGSTLTAPSRSGVALSVENSVTVGIPRFSPIAPPPANPAAGATIVTGMTTSSGRVEEAMRVIDRRLFLPVAARPYADVDAPLAIGYGATNSQPWTVRYMLAGLQVQPGQRVLDVGSGSGWTTALLGWLTGPQGSVTGLEVVPQLVAMGRANLAATDQPWCRIEQAEPGVLGLPEEAPFDRILVSAAARRLPEDLVAQLGPQGRMLVPVDHDMWVVEKTDTGRVRSARTGDRFNFVPLV